MAGERADLAGILAARAREVLGSLTHELRTVGWFDVLRASRCPSAVDDTDYRDTSANARRRVALAALRIMVDAPRPLTPFAAVEQVLADPPGTLADWVAGLPPGGRAAVTRDALAMVHLARAQLSWPPKGVIDAFPLEVMVGSSVKLVGRCEGKSRPGQTPRSLLLLTWSPQQAEATHLAAAYTALVWTLARGGREPLDRVVHHCLATGSWGSISVDERLLDTGLTAAVAALAALTGQDTARTPGPWCRRCGRAAGCAPGQAWLTGPGRRVGGLLPES